MHRTLRFSAATITFLALGPSSWVHGGGKPGKMVVAGLVLATAAGISAASPEAALAVTEPQLLHGVRTWQSDLVRIQERAAPCRLGPAPECPSTLLFAADVDLSAFNAVLTSKVKALREKLVKVDPVTDENPFAVGHPIPEPDPCPDTPHAPTDFHAYMDWEADQAIRLAEIQTLRILSACTGEGGAPEALTASQAQGLVTSLSTLNHLDGVLSQMKVNEYGYQLARTQTKLIATQIGLDLQQDGQSPRQAAWIKELTELTSDLAIFNRRLGRLTTAQSWTTSTLLDLAEALRPASPCPAMTGEARDLGYRFPDEDPRQPAC